MIVGDKVFLIERTYRGSDVCLFFGGRPISRDQPVKRGVSCCRLPAGFPARMTAHLLMGMSVAVFSFPPIAFSRDDTETETLSEIIVTARKVEENLQDVPMSVQVLSREFLDDADLSRLYEMQFNVPGLVVNNLGMFGAGFSLRGVADQGRGSLSIAAHLNGIYLGASNLAIARLFDLERVEVLKGPQGTLYGRNSTAGSINFITRAPEKQPGAEIEASYGSFETRRVQGHLNVSFDQVDVRVAFIGSEGDGYIRNSVDRRKFAEQDFWGLRGSLRADLNENLRLDLTVQHIRDDGASGELWTPNPAFLADPDDIRVTTVTLPNPYLETESDNVAVDVAYDLGFASAQSITGYARSEVRGLDDCAGIPELQGCLRGVRPLLYDQWSQEFRLVSREATPVDWLVGAYFFDAEASTHFHFMRPLFSPLPINDSSSTSDEAAYALFGQTTLPLGDQWRVTGGLRLSHEEHRVSDIGTGSDDHATLTTADNDWGRTSWRVDLEYTTGGGTLLYGGVSTGFKSGGITTTILPDGGFNTFDAEDIIAYEAGIKTQWVDRRLTLNVAGFYYDFRDLQISAVYLFNNRVITEVENAGQAEIHGIDVAGTLVLSDGLTVSGGVVWLPTREFVEFDSNITGDAYAGNELARAPEWTATAALEYSHTFGDRGALTGRVEYNYRSDFYFTADNDPRHAQADFGLLNLLLTYEPTDGSWRVFASGRNLTDEDYFNQVFLQSSPGYPDTYEIGVAYRF